MFYEDYGSIAYDDYGLPEHDGCEHCEEYVCRSPDCVVTDDCVQVGNSACPSIWTGYQLVVHARCVPAWDASVEKWEQEHVYSDCDNS